MGINLIPYPQMGINLIRYPQMHICINLIPYPGINLYPYLKMTMSNYPLVYATHILTHEKKLYPLIYLYPSTGKSSFLYPYPRG